MNILEEIIQHKKSEVSQRQDLFPVKLLEQSLYYETVPVSLKKYLLREDKSGIIAEIKRKSPSKGVINANISVERVSIGYMQAGASALSVLTDTSFFGGKNEDLITARKYNFCPILRKDFIVDEYQIVEAKSIGADAVLLIAAALTQQETKQLAAFAKKLGLEVLLELHHEGELDYINEYIDLVGVNNRDLTSFNVDIETSVRLAELLPADIVKISESGIHAPKDVAYLRKHGYNGFLIGEKFMKNSRPEKACAKFIEGIREIEEKDHVRA